MQLSATWFDIAHKYKYISYKKKINDIFAFKKKQNINQGNQY